MKLLSPIAGLVLVGLLVPSIVADISLKLKNQSYLPPPIQEVHEAQKQHHQNRRTFHEDKYANSRYQIFEVHNHYEPSAGNDLNEPASQINNGYLPAQQQEQKIHIQHINTPSDYPFDNLNLDASYLSLASDSDADNQPIIVKHETRATASNNNPSHNVPVPFPSNYQHQFPASKPKTAEYLAPKQNYESARSRQTAFQKVNTLGSQYLPPHNTQQHSQQFSRQQQNSLNGNQQQAAQKIVSESKTFKGPDYLPPYNGNSFKGSVHLPAHQSDSTQQHQQQQTSFRQNSPFKGADYLPPHHQGSINAQPETFGQNVQYKGPDYLPPNEKVRNQQQQTSFQPNNPFKGPDYLPPHTQGSTQQQTQTFEENNSFKAPDYLPPQPDNSGQHQSTSPQQNIDFKGNQQSEYQNIQTNIKSSSYLPSGYISQKPLNSEQAIAELHTLPDQTEEQYKQEVTVGTQIQASGREKSNNIIYGAPKQANPSQSVRSHQTTGYLPPGYDFRNPDNVPQPINELHSQIEEQYKQEVTVGTQIQVNGREKSNNIIYGTPKLANPSQSVRSHQTTGYLPPGYDFRNPDNDPQPINELYSQIPIQQQVKIPVPVLPSGYDFQKPENFEEAISQLHSQDTFAPQQSQVSNPVKTPEYSVPDYDIHKPENSEQTNNQLHSINTLQVQQSSRSASENVEGQSYNAPGYLPPGYEFQNPDDVQPATNQVHSQSHDYQATTQQNSYQTSHNLEHNYNQQVQSYGQHQQQPQTYNQGPVTQQAETYQNQESQQQTYSPVQSQQNVQQMGHHENQPSDQAFEGPDYLPPVAAAQRASVGYKAPDYLPPVASAPSSSIQQINQPLVPEFKGPDYLPPQDNSAGTQPAFKGPDYLPPINAPPQDNSVIAYQANNQQAPQQAQLKAPEHLPPTPATPSQPIQATYMYPLSSYMTSVKPFERYGSARNPFPEYGPPATTASTFFANNEVSSMYREPASRPQYYAPAMSYEKNAVNTQTYTTYKEKQYPVNSALNQQTRQTLQTFMPKDLRQEIPADHASSTDSIATTALQTTKPASAKIRTVQIINANAVKTLKVLEFLDHAGVKTIKILGRSHHEPMGDHRVVKVVSGHNQSQQTVKIFNDQQDVTLAVNQSPNSSANNSYLPPRHKRNPIQKSKAKGHHSI